MAILLQSNESEPETSVNTLLGGHVSVDVAGGVDYNLSEADAQNAYITLTGAITANINVILPTNEEKGWKIYNNTTGSFTVTIKTSAGTGVAITQTKKQEVACDGTNVAAWGVEF